MICCCPQKIYKLFGHFCMLKQQIKCCEGDMKHKLFPGTVRPSNNNFSGTAKVHHKAINKAYFLTKKSSSETLNRSNQFNKII